MAWLLVALFAGCLVAVVAYFLVALWLYLRSVREFRRL